MGHKINPTSIRLNITQGWKSRWFAKPQHFAKLLEEEAVSIIQNSLLGTEGEAWNRLDGTLKELNGLLKGFIISGSLKTSSVSFNRSYSA